MSQLLNDERGGARDYAQRRSSWPFVAALSLSLAAIEWLSYLTEAPRHPVLWTLLAACAVAAALWRGSRVRLENGLHRLQRVAPAKSVAEHLDELKPRGAEVFHDVQVDGINLDHLVICTHGIYAVEVNRWKKPWDTATIHLIGGDAIRVDVAPECNPTRQVGRATRWLERFFAEAMGNAPSVCGVLVLPRAWVAPAATPGVVCVSDPKALPAFIKRQPVALDARMVHLASVHLSRYLHRPVPRLLPRVTSR